jgi:hypothetical protein
MKRHVLLRKLMEFDARLDKTIFGDPDIGKKKPVEFSLLSTVGPTFGGSVVGQTVGALASKKKKLADGTWVDETGKPTSAPVAPAVGALAGAAAGYGAAKGHQSVMKNYGGGGGAAQAYKNAGRNVVQGAKTAATSAIPYMQDAGGVIKSEAGSAAANILKKLKGLKGAATAMLGRNPPKQLVEFEARLDAIIFSERTTDGTDKNGRWNESKRRQFLARSKKKVVTFDRAGVVPAVRRSSLNDVAARLRARA